MLLSLLGVFDYRRALSERRARAATRRHGRPLLPDPLNPDVPLFVADAIIGAVWGLFYQTIVGKGPQGMPEIAPLASYIALSPFIGAEAAAEVANGDGRGPRGEGSSGQPRVSR